MTGAQPRRLLESRVSSSVTRRAWAPPGVPGVWRVPPPTVRRRRSPELSVAGWIQGPDFEVTYPIGLVQSWFYGSTQTEPGDELALCEDLRDGVNLNEPPELVSILSDGPMMSVDITLGGVLLGVIESVAGQIPGATLTSLNNAETAGAYTPPTPSSGYALEYEHSTGTVVSDLALAGDADALTLEPNTYEPGGQLRWTTEDNLTFRSVTHMLSEYDLLHTWPEQSATPFTASIPLADSLGTDRETQGFSQVLLHVISEAVADPGTLATDGTSGGATGEARTTAQVYGGEVTVTVRPPRHRFVSLGGGDWIGSIDWNAYVWDAGLFLGTDWPDVTGLPASLPVDAGELHYYVAPAGVDVAVDNHITEPFGDFFINGSGNFEVIAPDPGTPPDAGSHIWVIWYGPAFNIGTDPVPSVDPASLIPASLAENGTG